MKKNHVKRLVSILYRIIFDSSFRREEFPIIIKYRQKKVSFGEQNPDKTFYVVRRVSAGEGLGSTYCNVLSDIQYADSKGWIPVVDQLNYFNGCLQETDKKDKENAWEYFWKQPTKYSLYEAYKSKNVVLGAAVYNEHWMYWEDTLKVYYDKEYRKKLIDIKNRYYSFNDEVQNYLDEGWKKFKEKYEHEKILAVSVRLNNAKYYKKYIQGDTNVGLVIGTPISLNYDETIHQIKELCLEHHFTKVFISDDSDELTTSTDDYIKERVVFLDRKKVNAEKNNGYESYYGIIKNKAMRFNLEYLLEMYIASKCDGILASPNSTTTAILLMNGLEYKEEVLINKGLYSEKAK